MTSTRWILIATLILVTASATAAHRFWPESEPIGTSHAGAAEAWRQGLDELHRFRHARAAKSFVRAIGLDPEFAVAHLDLGRAKLRLGDGDGGRASISRADSLAQIEGNAATAFERARTGHLAALTLEDVGRAEHLAEVLEREFADHAYTLTVRAERAKHRGKSEEAGTLYRRLLELYPERVDVHNSLGYLALEQGRYEDAVASFQRYVYYVDDSANPHDSLGEAFLWTGRYHESAQEYLRALEIDPTYIVSALGATDALAITGQYRRAFELMDTTASVFEERGQRATLELKRVQVMHAAQRWADVVAYTTRLLDDPAYNASSTPGHDVWVRGLRALARVEVGQVVAAQEDMSKCESLFENMLETLPSTLSSAREDLRLMRATLRARFAVRTGDDAAAALGELHGLLQTSDRQPHRLLGFRAALVECLVDAGLYEEAIEVSAAILDFNPRHPRTHMALARAYLEQRDRESALAHLRSFLAMMGQADEDAPRVKRARRLIKQIAPSS